MKLVRESISNFERGRDPKETLKIGSARRIQQNDVFYGYIDTNTYDVDWQKITDKTIQFKALEDEAINVSNIRTVCAQPINYTIFTWNYYSHWHAMLSIWLFYVDHKWTLIKSFEPIIPDKLIIIDSKLSKTF